MASSFLCVKPAVFSDTPERNKKLVIASAVGLMVDVGIFVKKGVLQAYLSLVIFI